MNDRQAIMKRVLLALVILVLIAAGLAYVSLYSAYQGFHEPVILDFPKEPALKPWPMTWRKAA